MRNEEKTTMKITFFGWIRFFCCLVACCVMIPATTACTKKQEQTTDASAPQTGESKKTESSSSDSALPTSSLPSSGGSSNWKDDPPVDPAVDADLSPISLNIGTYNIANGYNVGYDMSILAKDILDQKLDIVGFEEVDKNCDRSKNLDTMKVLSEKTGYKYYCFFKAINLGSGEYGIGVLSKYPILENERIALDSSGGEQRVMGRVKIDVEGTALNFFVTHLAYESYSLRAKQFEQVNSILRKYDNFLIVGDFNIISLTEYQAIENSGAVNTPEHFLYTYPSTKECLDNIVYSSRNWTFGEGKVLNNNHSDHSMLYASAQFLPGSLASGTVIRDGNGKTYETLADGKKSTAENIGKWKEGTSGCYIEIDLGGEYNLSSLNVVNARTCDSVYKWAAYATDDNGQSIDRWSKIGEKTDGGKATGAGYTVTLSEEDAGRAFRYIRVYGTFHSENEDYQIAEVSVYGQRVADNSRNLTENAVITDQNGKKYSSLKDGVTDKYLKIGAWAPGTSGCYVEIDLGEPAFLSSLKVVHPAGENRVYKWVAYASADNTLPIDQWTKIAEKTGDEVSTAAGYTAQVTKSAKNTQFRYVRIYGTFHSDDENFHLTEVAVYGMFLSAGNNLTMNTRRTSVCGCTDFAAGFADGREDFGCRADVVAGFSSVRRAAAISKSV